MECKICGSAEFRLSRLRVADLSVLIFFLYPVRCRVCYKRGFVNFFTALRIRHQSKLRHEAESGSAFSAQPLRHRFHNV